MTYAEIALLWLLSAWLFYNGLPDLSLRGFLLTLAGLLAFMAGFGLLLHVSETVRLVY